MKQSVPLVSVILPAYNSMRTLAECLGSLERNRRDLEPGLVEVVAPVRRSMDGTRDALAAKQYVRVIDHDGIGISPAYNLGIKECKGRFAIFLNSDDELGDGFIKTVLELALVKDVDRHVVYTSVEFIDSKGRHLYFRHPAPYIDFIQKHYSIILHPNALYPVALLKKHPFEELPGAPPRDREQVYHLMKSAVSTRTRAVNYRYRIWSSSGTVVLAKRKPVWAPIDVRLVRFMGRIWVQSRETRLLQRSLAYLRGKASAWQKPS